MSLNPLDEQLQNEERDAAVLEVALKDVIREIEWFEGTRLETLLGQLDELQSNQVDLSRTLDQIAADVLQLENEIWLVSESIGPLWNPWNWFDSQQRGARARKKDLVTSLVWVTGRYPQAQSHLRDVQARERGKSAEVARYRGLDLDAKTTEREALNRQLLQQKQRVEATNARKIQVDEALEPILRQILGTEQKKADAGRAIGRAQQFQNELWHADNSYERAMVHQECESVFGSGKPGQVIHEREAEIRRLNRDLEKLQIRAKNVATRAARDVKRLILDGSNLCYEGDKFIGLGALSVLVPVLAAAYDVVVVFDASITGELTSSDRDIRNALGGETKIHVVAPGVDADETVLDLAGSDQTVFVLSNDRFAEFREKAAVRDGRLIRHEIVAGRVLVHDLSVSEAFEDVVPAVHTGYGIASASSVRADLPAVKTLLRRSE